MLVKEVKLLSFKFFKLERFLVSAKAAPIPTTDADSFWP